MKLSLAVLVLAAVCPLPFAEASEEEALVDVVPVAKQAARQTPRRKNLGAPLPVRRAAVDAAPEAPLRQQADGSPRRYSRPPPL